MSAWRTRPTLAATGGLLLSAIGVPGASAVPVAGLCWNPDQPETGLVACTQPHTSQIVEILDLPKKLIKKRSPVAAYRWAQRRCRERVNDYVGVRPEHAALGRSYFAGYELAKWRVYADWPRKVSDRWMICAADSAETVANQAQLRAIDFSVAGASGQLKLTSITADGLTYTLIAQIELKGSRFPGAGRVQSASDRACTRLVGPSLAMAFGPDRKPWRQGWRTANCWTSTPAA